MVFNYSYNFQFLDSGIDFENFIEILKIRPINNMFYPDN